MTKQEALELITKMRDERQTLVRVGDLDRESYRHEIKALTIAIAALIKVTKLPLTRDK